MTNHKKPPSAPGYVRNRATDTEDFKQRVIPVYESLHRRIKEVAEKQGITMYEAYAQATRMYIKSHGIEVPEIGTLTTDEKTFVEDALKIYRGRKHNNTFDQVVSMIQTMIRLVTKTQA